MYISFQSDSIFSQNRFPFLQETNKNKENHDNGSVLIDRELLQLYFSSFSLVIVLIEKIKQKLETMFDQSASHLEGGQKYSGTHLFSTLFSVFQNVVNCDHLCLMHYVNLASLLCNYVTPNTKLSRQKKVILCIPLFFTSVPLTNFSSTINIFQWKNPTKSIKKTLCKCGNKLCGCHHNI